MASRVVTQMISDLSGVEIADGEGEVVNFAYRGTLYTIDLTADEAAEFDEAVSRYVENATRRGRNSAPQRAASRNPTSDAKTIREWAQARGIDVPTRGRIPAEVRQQYEASH